MSPRNTWFFTAVIIILLILVFFAPSYGWQLRAWLGPQGPAMSPDSVSLAAQNQTLAAQLAELQVIQQQIPVIAPNTVRAMVYSRYPLNYKGELLVEAGANEGIVAGKAVLFQGVLVGVVQKVFPDSALVTTVFDPSFKMPVRIGNAGIDALYQGGTNPQALSIDKKAKVSVGDIVVAAGSGIPYGVPIAQVAGLSASPNSLFNQATLTFAYDINSIQTVVIEK